jgi:hypothetical protein
MHDKQRPKFLKRGFSEHNAVLIKAGLVCIPVGRILIYTSHPEIEPCVSDSIKSWIWLGNHNTQMQLISRRIMNIQSLKRSSYGLRVSRLARSGIVSTPAHSGKRTHKATKVKWMGVWRVLYDAERASALSKRVDSHSARTCHCPDTCIVGSQCCECGRVCG